ncbi:MAG: twin-arginine translocation signal domain-containing protein [Planctomycetota bacterium]|nr:twin-arginine translocation signal domain-containing protein [Planctomycetota bacterium]
MQHEINRRNFLKESFLASAGGAMALGAVAGKASAAEEEKKPPAPAGAPQTLPFGKLGKLQVSRILLGGNLLTHYTHSRDLKYVYNLCAHYNTDEKILETLALAEQNGINTVSMHNPPKPMQILYKYRKGGGKIQWIICPTADVMTSYDAYTAQVRELVDNGCEAIYVWGVRSDQLLNSGKPELIGKCVEIAKEHGVLSGVGCHNLKVVEECERLKIPADFYIKTFHHHKYPSGPKPEQIKGPYNENPGYWCADPEATIKVMSTVEKPWMAFKVMAAGAIPPENAMTYAFGNGADHILLGMFDFEIAQDVELANKVLAATAKRERPWRS